MASTLTKGIVSAIGHNRRTRRAVRPPLLNANHNNNNIRHNRHNRNPRLPEPTIMTVRSLSTALKSPNKCPVIVRRWTDSNSPLKVNRRTVQV
ncbi:unnamed protein product [Medioppia subpectinata]|uniref:Uncharacterized protein n=1 Tax=Medioppia subpectinata TaxID=1979941 RepID=A0A7R9LQA9_9ACAR|nr:unnamed protein product [Medioppia subpectinata]CAG2120459.1 unnamed protein product [Medioppia subpectinata]